MSSGRVGHGATSLTARPDAATFAKFYHECRDPLYRSVLGLVRDPVAAEDIVADTMTLMWQRWSEINRSHNEDADGFPRMRAFAHTTARYKVLDFWRRSKRDYPVESFDPDSGIFASSSSASYRTEFEETLRVIGELPDRQRRALALRIWGYDDSEVAEQFGVGEATVRSHLSIARRKVFDYLNSTVWAREGGRSGATATRS